MDKPDIQETHILYAKYEDSVHGNVKIFTLALFGPMVHVRIPDNVHKNYRLLRVSNADSGEDVHQYVYDELLSPWIDFPVDILEKSAKVHTYILEFESLLTHDNLFLYFAYQIQNDNPDQPYIYMKRD